MKDANHSGTSVTLAAALAALVATVIPTAAWAANTTQTRVSLARPDASACGPISPFSYSMGVATALCPPRPGVADAVGPGVPGGAAPSGLSTEAPVCGPSALPDRCEAWITDFYNGTGNGPDYSGSVDTLNEHIAATSRDGKIVYQAGTTDTNPSTGYDWDIALFAVDAATGSRLWTRTYAGSEERRDAQAYSLVVGGTTVFVTGTRSASLEDPEAVVLAFDGTTGTLLWESVFPGVLFTSAANPDGSRLFVGGAKFGTNGIAIGTIRALDGTTGETVWNDSLAATGGNGINGYRLAATPDGNRVVLAAGRFSTSGLDMGVTQRLVIATYDGTVRALPEDEGTRLSVVEHPSQGTLPLGVVVNSDGTRAYVTQSLAVSDTLTIGVDTVEGKVAWTHQYGGPAPGSSWTFAWGYQPIALSPNGKVVYVGEYEALVVGQVKGFALEAIQAVQGSPSEPAAGTQLWTAHQTGNVATCYGCGPSVTAPTNSRVVITGQIPYPGVAYQFMTTAYDASGVPVWTRVFREGRTGYSRTIVPSPDGSRVYVAGSAGTMTATATDRSVDILMTAYDTA
ncbi:MAG: PQQ-binding-like beta-propeller repeat protein [Actinomycetota bacterium]